MGKGSFGRRVEIFVDAVPKPTGAIEYTFSISVPITGTVPRD